MIILHVTHFTTTRLTVGGPCGHQSHPSNLPILNTATYHIQAAIGSLFVLHIVPRTHHDSGVQLALVLYQDASSKHTKCRACMALYCIYNKLLDLTQYGGSTRGTASALSLDFFFFDCYNTIMCGVLLCAAGLDGHRDWLDPELELGTCVWMDGIRNKES